jgi:PII-like signaling protein
VVVNDDCLTLTCYFGERHRSGGRFLADALLDIYEQHEIAASIMLRGIEGFGLKHHLRSDRSLTLSEDLPAVVVAVDAQPKIDRVIDEVAALAGVGLVTLERARLVTAAVTAPAPAHDATKLTVYLGRQQRVDRAPGYLAVCDLLHRHGAAGATALLGVDGTSRGVRQRARLFGRNADVPTIVMAIVAGETMARVLPELGALVDDPLMSIERVQICKRDGERLAEPREVSSTDEHGMALWQKLTVVASEAARHDDHPIHRLLTRRLRAAGASGATTVRGIWGFHGDTEPHGDRALRVVRHVPTVTTVVDTPARIRELFPIVDAVTREHGLVTAELVPAMRARAHDRERGGLGLAGPSD